MLGRWEQGEPGAVESLAPLVYDQLRAIAEALLRNERPDHTLQATAIVNEVFMDLLRVRRLAINDRAHFFSFAAQLTRRVLVDSARKAKAEKRGAGWTRIPLDAELVWLSNRGAESLDLSAALNELEKLDASKTRAVELHYCRHPAGLNKYGRSQPPFFPGVAAGTSSPRVIHDVPVNRYHDREGD